MFDQSIKDLCRAVEGRANSKSINALLRHNAELLQVNRKTLEEREADAYNKFVHKLAPLLKDGKDRQVLLNTLVAYTHKIENIYFDLEMKVGASLQLQLLSGFGQDD